MINLQFLVGRSFHGRIFSPHTRSIAMKKIKVLESLDERVIVPDNIFVCQTTKVNKWENPSITTLNYANFIICWIFQYVVCKLQKSQEFRQKYQKMNRYKPQQRCFANNKWTACTLLGFAFFLYLFTHMPRIGGFLQKMWNPVNLW